MPLLYTLYDSSWAAELFTEPGNPQLLTRCAVWYGADAQAKWLRRGGV